MKRAMQKVCKNITPEMEAKADAILASSEA